MSITFEEFVRSITDSGLMDSEEIKSFLGTLPMEHRPRTAEDLAKEMYQRGKLTKFQAHAIYQKKTRGLVVGNYVVLDKLGRGGMGAVYKAQHKRMKRVVALKMLPSSATKSPEAVKRFQREVEAAAKLSHPNIVTAYDADEAKGVHFLVMEFVDGQDLHALVKEHGTLSVARAVDYVVQAAKGLEYAHSQGVIHRDIKPGNLLLDKNGTVKILDMGLARIEETVAGTDATANDGLTQSGQVMGTLDYMPPEQALDTRTADARADIYSLGCTFCFLLTGRSPYGGDTVGKKIVAHREHPIPSLRKVRSNVPESLDAVFQKMLAKLPEDRQQSMSEVIRELQGCTVQREPAPSSFPPSSSPYAETVDFQREDTAPPLAALSPLDELFASEPVQITQRLVAPSLRTRKRWTKKQKIVVGVVAGGMTAFLLLLTVIVKMVPSPSTATQERVASVAAKKAPEPGSGVVSPLAVAPNGAGKGTPANVRHEVLPARTVSTTSNDPDREATQWVLERGGTLEIVLEGQKRTVKATNELPSGSFKVSCFFFNDNLSIGDQICDRLRELTSLDGFWLARTGVTGQGFDRLRSAKRLTFLGLDNSPVTDVGMACLSQLTSLKRLSLNVTQITDAGLAHVQRLPLEQLDVAWTAVTANGLTKLTGLKALAVSSDDAMLETLTAMTKLEYIHLMGSKVTDNGLRHLSRFPNLKSVCIRNTPFTDKGLEYLKPLRNLVEISLLDGTQVTAQGVDALKAALPNCKIVWKPPSGQMVGAISTPVESPQNVEEGFVSLFDGKTLNGWHKIGIGDWSVENGAIVGRNGTAHDKFGHLVTNVQFADFTVRLKFKVPKGNSGLYFRCEEGGYTGIVGPQIDIFPPQYVGSFWETYTQSGGRQLVDVSADAVRRYFKPDDWNDLRLEVRGNRIVSFINKVKTAEWQQDHGPIKGPLAIQMGGDVPELAFKDISIREQRETNPNDD